jgi:hypothetical protein
MKPIEVPVVRHADASDGVQRVKVPAPTTGTIKPKKEGDSSGTVRRTDQQTNSAPVGTVADSATVGGGGRRIGQSKKYGNVKTLADGILFDSKAEAERYGELKSMQAAGEICFLECQVPFRCDIGKKHVCTWKADFTYRRPFGVITSLCVEDVKSEATRKNAVYRLKKRLVEACFGVNITEIVR